MLPPRVAIPPPQVPRVHCVAGRGVVAACTTFFLNTFLYIRDDYDGGGVNRRFDQLDTDEGRLARYLSLYVFVQRSLDVFEYLYSYTPLGVYSF